MKYLVFHSFKFMHAKNISQVIVLDPSSPSGYERKYAALHGIGHYDDATDAFETMLSKMSQSSDPEIRGKCNHTIRVSLFTFSHRAISPLCQ